MECFKNKTLKKKLAELLKIVNAGMSLILTINVKKN